jgi:hypothetical protein
MKTTMMLILVLLCSCTTTNRDTAEKVFRDAGDQIVQQYGYEVLQKYAPEAVVMIDANHDQIVTLAELEQFYKTVRDDPELGTALLASAYYLRRQR